MSEQEEKSTGGDWEHWGSVPKPPQTLKPWITKSVVYGAQQSSEGDRSYAPVMFGAVVRSIEAMHDLNRHQNGLQTV